MMNCQIWHPWIANDAYLHTMNVATQVSNELTFWLHSKNSSARIFSLLFPFLDDFLWAGQNLGIYGQSDDYPDTDSTIALLINLWFDEYKTTNMDVIRSYNLPRRGR